MSNQSNLIQEVTKRDYSASLSYEPEDFVSVGTSKDYESECWSLINNFLNFKGAWKLTKTQRRTVDTLVRRAKLFYQQYNLTKDDPGSSLLAYYFAMNLAKAYMVARDTKFIKTEFSHGLSFIPSKKNIVKTNTNGSRTPIYTELYNYVTGASVGESLKYKIEDVFSGVNDLSFQAYILKIRNHAIRVEFTVLQKEEPSGAKTVWPIIRIDKSDLDTTLQNKTFTRNFNRYFDKIELNGTERKKIFDSRLQEMKSSSFFQSKKTFPFDSFTYGSLCENEVRKAFDNRVRTNFYDRNYNLDVFLPFRGHKENTHNELLNMYVGLYWCSSIVRYDPTISLLGEKNSKLSSIYNETNRVAPYLVLREFLNLFAKRSVSFTSRS